MEHLPEKEYNGLTVVLSQPSRQDTQALLSGYAGTYFNQECLAPQTSRWRCHIRTADTIDKGLLANTRAILLLGEGALGIWAEAYKDYTINEQRGCPLSNRWNLPMLCSYAPQDAVDYKNYEATLNPLLSSANEEDEGESGDEYDTKKRHGRTSRKNFRFWLKRDTQKIIWSLTNPLPKHNFEVKIFPMAEEVLEVLLHTKDEDLFYDIETDSDYNISCFGFSFSGSNVVYSVPILRYDYTLAYGKTTYKLIRALVLALNSNCVCIHNSSFDLFIGAWRYGLPFGRRIYDTMYSQHRCFPEAEKSLGHSLSCWPTIWEPFHKDESCFEPNNIEQEKQLWNYNAKDVIAMRLIKDAQLTYARNTPGLIDSITQSNKCIYSFILNSLFGIRIEDSVRLEYIEENDRLLTQYTRAINILTGSSINILPSSSKSCVRYFHDALEYPIIGRSKKTGEPSLDETNLLRLKLKNPLNATIDFCIKYRQVKKEQGSISKLIPLPKYAFNQRLSTT